MSLPPDLAASIQRALSEALGSTARLGDHSAIGGGCVAHAARLETSAGAFFLKWSAGVAPDTFLREAEGLEALANAETGLRVPRSICVGADPAFIVMTYLEPGRRAAGFDEALGRGLASLHRSSAPRFGFPHDNYCGASPQPNGWMDRWVDFYRARRLGFQLQLATEAGRSIPRSDRGAYERLLAKLEELLAIDPEPPALLHGDLWGGNLHVAPDGGPSLIDPAAYYGHREAELGMMVLFGGFSRRVFEAYHEAYPLQPGWRERLPLYTLYHLMNHYTLFGGHYGRQAFEIARRFT